MRCTTIGAIVVAAGLVLGGCAGSHKRYQGPVSNTAAAGTQGPQAGVVNPDGTAITVPNEEQLTQPMSPEVVPEDPGEQVSRPDELTETVLLKLTARQSRMVPAPPKSPSSAAPPSSEQVSRDTESYFDPSRHTGSLPQSMMR